MTDRRYLLLLGVIVAAVWGYGLFHIQSLRRGADEAQSALSSARQRAELLERELGAARKEVKRLGQVRDDLEGDVRRLEERQERQALIDGLPSTLQKVRGLKPLAPLRANWVSRAQTRAFMESEIKRQVPAAYADAYVRTLSRVGLFPAGFELGKALVGLYAEQAAGYYDPKRKALYVNDGIPMADVVLAHEIAHALADQHFDLRKLMPDGVRDHDDRVFAVQALVEGEATWTMAQYVRSQLSLFKLVELASEVMKLARVDAKQLEAAPRWIREPLLQAYLTGMTFVLALHQAGGTARIDAAFRAPPESSEQILHPEKYLAGERPVAVTLPDLGALLPDHKALHENTLGELGLRIVFQNQPETAAEHKLAAAGWGGDRLRSYLSTQGRLLVVWRIVMDTAVDAGELQGAFNKWLTARYGPRRGEVHVAPHGLVALLAKDKEVLLIDGAASAAQLATLATAFQYAAPAPATSPPATPSTAPAAPAPGKPAHLVNPAKLAKPASPANPIKPVRPSKPAAPTR